ncbi:MAG: hypothetical protein ACLGPL_04835 [Acidobacteriota bacterium]
MITMDFNHRSPNERLNALLDAAIVADRSRQQPRNYLGGSRLGHPCERALQFEYFHSPKDEGKDFSGRILRIFEVGHALEDLAIRWIRLAGFDLRNEKRDGGQFGFSVAGGRIRGHIDGVLCGGPDAIKYPALWECKTMNHKKWNECVKGGVAKSHPVYAAQIAVYQAYMGLTENPAIFTSINKDTEEIWFEAVPFDSALAQRMSDRGVRILRACDAGEILPRIAQSRDHFECRMCSYAQRCWALSI